MANLNPNRVSNVPFESLEVGDHVVSAVTGNKGQISRIDVGPTKAMATDEYTSKGMIWVQWTNPERVSAQAHEDYEEVYYLGDMPELDEEWFARARALRDAKAV